MHPIFCPIYIRCSYYTAWHQSQYHLIFWCGVRNCGLGRAILYFYCFVFFFFAQNWFITKIFFFFFFLQMTRNALYIYFFIIYFDFLECVWRGVQSIFFSSARSCFHWLRYLFFTCPLHFFVFHKIKELLLFSRFQTTTTEAWAILTLYRLQTSTLFFYQWPKTIFFHKD